MSDAKDNRFYRSNPEVEMVTVPKEPTDKMLEAAMSYASQQAWPTQLGMVSIYKRMIEAANE